MRYLYKNIINSKFIIFLRNSLKIKPASFYINKNLTNSSISDSFCWRTDEGYITKFKFSDIFYLFFELENSWVEIDFFDRDNNFLKKIKINKLNVSNEIIIDRNFLDGVKSYGIFYIYHFYDNSKNNKNETLINRCYVGYSKDDKFFSFVHGNTLSKYKKNNSPSIERSDIVSTSFFKNHIYSIQKNFEEYDKSELIFTNPTNKKIQFRVDSENHTLGAGCAKKISFSNKKKLSINTNCLWLRPVVFSYKQNYFDVHHS